MMDLMLEASLILVVGMGVVFLSLKFCEPDLFDVPSLAAGLKARGIPVLSVDVELGPATSAGLATRIEAFLESLP